MTPYTYYTSYLCFPLVIDTEELKKRKMKNF